MNGRNITYIDANEENDFLPMPDHSIHADIIYICSPNNPTGAAYNREQLKQWVDYALENSAVILYDSAYECFITDRTLPRSIYAIEGSKNVPSSSVHFPRQLASQERAAGTRSCPKI